MAGTSKRRRARVRYAVVGAGNIAQEAVLPGFKGAARNSELVALVSSDEKKRQVLGRRYGLEQVGDYDAFEDVLRDSAADAVYIATPNTEHRDFTERAAAAGVHVLCEKPMAASSVDCLAMMEATATAGVRLMIAYRLHFEEANLKALKLVRSGRLGRLVFFEGMLTHQVRGGDIRTRAETGGGTLLDAGIYPINAARALFGEEPVEVVGRTIVDPDQRFEGGVDATAMAVLSFPGGGIASIASSQAASSASYFRLVGEKASLEVDPAFGYATERRHRLTIGKKTTERTFPKVDQFGAEILYFSRCILENREPEPAGLEGLADVQVIEAILESAAKGRTVRIERMEKPRGPRPEQKISLPPVHPPPLVDAPSPKQ
jgi:predicted dehydrogenase